MMKIRALCQIWGMEKNGSLSNSGHEEKQEMKSRQHFAA